MSLQSADNAIPDHFYRLSLPYIKNKSTLLNLGCGILFNFEKLVYKEKGIRPVCVDIIDISKLGLQKPDCVDNFLVKSIEEEVVFENKFDVVTFFEVVEHIDKTDILLKNCFNNLKDGGTLVLSFPNLASIYSRIELLLGFQPHILEVSNEQSNFGTGIFGKLHNKHNKPIHHIRGVTNRAMKEMLEANGFKIVKTIGYEWRLKKLLYFFPSIAPVNIVVCKKL